MGIKPQLQEIFKEYKDLFSKSTNINEVQTMKRFKEENQAKSDTQANPTSVNTPLPANDAGAPKQDAPQNDKGIQKENESGKDTQAAPPAPVQASDGTPVKTDAPQNAKDMQKEQMQTIPAAPEEKDEEAAPKEKDLKEKFAEMEGDMGKVVDVVEALKNQVEALNQRLSEMEGKMGKEEEEEPAEPQAPVTESAILKGAFAESAAKSESNEFGKAASNFLKRII